MCVLVRACVQECTFFMCLLACVKFVVRAGDVSVVCEVVCGVRGHGA